MDVLQKFVSWCTFGLKHVCIAGCVLPMYLSTNFNLSIFRHRTTKSRFIQLFSSIDPTPVMFYTAINLFIYRSRKPFIIITQNRTRMKIIVYLIDAVTKTNDDLPSRHDALVNSTT